MGKNREREPSNGWVHLNDGWMVPNGLYTKNPSPHLKNTGAKAVQTAPGVFRIEKDSKK